MTPCNKKDSQSHSTGYNRGCRCEDCKAAKKACVSAWDKTPRAKASAAKRSKRYALKPAVMAAKQKRQQAYRQTALGKSNRKQEGRARKALVRGVKEHVSPLNAIYALCPAGWHVDHIVPLAKGGLHEPANLQYLTACDNIAKGTKTDYTPVTPAQRWQDWACTLI